MGERSFPFNWMALLVAGVTFCGSSAAYGHECESKLLGTPTLHFYKIKLDRPMRFRGQTLSGVYRFVEAQPNRYIDVDGFFGLKNRPGMKGLVHVLRVLAPTPNSYIAAQLLEGRVQQGQIEEPSKLTPMKWPNFVKAVWKVDHNWDAWPFFPPQDRSLMTMNAARGTKIDEALRELAFRNQFEQLPFPDVFTFNELASFFKSQAQAVSAELLKLTEFQPSPDENPITLDGVLATAARSLIEDYERNYSTTRKFKSSDWMDLSSLDETELNAITQLRTKIRAILQECRAAIRVNDLVGFQVKLSDLRDRQLISEEQYQQMVSQNINPKRELDILTRDTIFEIKSGIPLLGVTVIPTRQPLRSGDTIQNRIQRQAEVQNQIIESVNSKATDSSQLNRLSRFIIYTDGKVLKPHDSEKDAKGIIFPTY